MKKRPTKITCVHCQEKYGVRADIYEKRIKAFGSEEALLKSYTCQKCRTKMGVQADGEYKEHTQIKNGNRKRNKNTQPEVTVLEGTKKKLLSHFRDKLNVEPFNSDRRWSLEQSMRDPDSKGSYTMEASTQLIEGQLTKIAKTKKGIGFVGYYEAIRKFVNFDKRFDDWEVNYFIKKKKVKILKK